MGQIRISVLANDPLTRAALSSHLSAELDMTVVAHDAEDSPAVVVVAGFRVSIAVTALLRQAAERCGAPVVLVVSDITLQELLIALESGVAAVIPRRRFSRDQLVRDVRTVIGGGGSLPPTLLKGVLHHVVRQRPGSDAPMRCDPVYDLTTRELRVLRLLADGMDTAEISVELRYSERTVKTVIQDVRQRLKARNRAQAVAHAARHGVI